MLADGGRARTDPAFLAHEGPVLAYARACWENWLPKWLRDRAFAVNKQALHYADGTAAWARVRGPLAATFLSAARIGWEWTSSSTVITQKGRILDFMLDPPAAIRPLIYEAVHSWRAAKLDAKLPHLKSNAKGPALRAAHRILKKPTVLDGGADGCTLKMAPHLRSGMTNGQWPQVRLYAANLSDSSECQLCGQKGTLQHRGSCPTTAAARGEYLPTLEVKTYVDALDEDTRRLLLTRGLHAAPCDLHPPLSEEQLHWTIYPENGILCNTWVIYLDGSLLDGPTKELGRVGFGFVALDRNGRTMASAYGIPPGW
jgi:hypothetical protein